MRKTSDLMSSKLTRYRSQVCLCFAIKIIQVNETGSRPSLLKISTTNYGIVMIRDWRYKNDIHEMRMKLDKQFLLIIILFFHLYLCLVLKIPQRGVVSIFWEHPGYHDFGPNVGLDSWYNLIIKSLHHPVIWCLMLILSETSNASIS